MRCSDESDDAIEDKEVEVSQDIAREKTLLQREENKTKLNDSKGEVGEGNAHKATDIVHEPVHFIYIIWSNVRVL